MEPRPAEEQRLLTTETSSVDTLHEEHNQTYKTFTSGTTTPPNDVVDTGKAVEDDDPGYTWTTIFMIMSTWIGVFLASLDMSVMATLTSAISESFSAFNLLTWFINAYTLTSALVQPLSGKLSDIYGRRNCLLWANFAFLLGTLICGLATKSWHFIFGRAVAGLGGGCLHSISTFLASDVIPLRSRGFWQGVSNVGFAAGFSLGGVIGGLINDSVGWRWAFLFQPAPILVSMVLVWWLVPHSTLNRDVTRSSLKQIDFLGSVILTLAILALMFGAVSGGNTYAWSNPVVYVPLMLCPFLLLAFGYVEERVARDPIIPVRLLFTRTIGGACMVNFLATVANTALLYYLPIIMEVKGLSPSQAGLRQIPSAAGAFTGSLSVGYLMNKTGRYYWFCVTSLVTVSVAAFVMLLTLKYVTGWVPALLQLFNGLGFGGMLVTTLIALVSAADHKQHAVLTSASYAFRTAGNTLGVTVAGAIFQNLFMQQLWARLGHEKDAADWIPAIRQRDVDLNHLPLGWRAKVMASYDVAFYAVFAFMLGSYVLGTVAASIIREHRLAKSLDRSK